MDNINTLYDARASEVNETNKQRDVGLLITHTFCVYTSHVSSIGNMRIMLLVALTVLRDFNLLNDFNDF